MAVPNCQATTTGVFCRLKMSLEGSDAFAILSECNLQVSPARRGYHCFGPRHIRHAHPRRALQRIVTAERSLTQPDGPLSTSRQSAILAGTVGAASISS